MDQAEFQEKQSAIYPDLAGAVIDCIPEDWDEALLTLGPPVTDGDVETMSHELTNPQLTSGLNAVLPDEAVFAQTRRLEMLFREFGAA